MGASRKSKRLTWASGVNLRQILLFSRQEPPSLVSRGSQNHLPSKPNDDVPPGFEIIRPAIRLPHKSSQVHSSTKWRCPPKFVIDSECPGVSGEESQEIILQDQRQLRVFEAMYPRPSFIPSNPVESDEANYNVDSPTIPVIPITPIEDEEEDDDDNVSPSTTAMQFHNPTGMPTTPAIPNTIDPHLLIEFLNNPKLVEQLLIHAHATSSTATLYAPNAAPPPNPIIPTFYPQLQPQTQTGGFVPRVQPQPMEAKRDVDYYKRLIQQHGEEKHDVMKAAATTTREVKTRKTCLYFNSPRGCRNGANCSYQHVHTPHKRFSDVSSEVSNGKRMKLTTT